MSKKWKVSVWNISASCDYIEYAQDEQTAIEIVRGKVTSDMKNWNFSTSLVDENSDSDNNN
jgi:hypothetical protein